MPIRGELQKKSGSFLNFEKNFQKQNEKFSKFSNIDVEARQICQFMERYEKIPIFFQFKKKKNSRQKLKTFQNFRIYKIGLKLSQNCQLMEK